MQLIFFLFLAAILVFGGAIVLLKTAQKPKVPKDLEPKGYQDDEDTGW